MNINIPNYYNISQDDFDKLKTLESFEITCQYCFNNFRQLDKYLNINEFDLHHKLNISW